MTFRDFSVVIASRASSRASDIATDAYVKLDDGSVMCGAQLHASSGPNYVFAASTYESLVTLDWVELTLDLTMAQAMVANFTANDIRQIGVLFDSGDPYEGGSFVGPLDTVFHIDSITAP